MYISNSELSTSELRCHVDITITAYVHHLISAFIHNEYIDLILIGTMGLVSKSQAGFVGVFFVVVVCFF